jgi:hypothetical protein
MSAVAGEMPHCTSVTTLKAPTKQEANSSGQRENSNVIIHIDSAALDSELLIDTRCCKATCTTDMLHSHKLFILV